MVHPLGKKIRAHAYTLKVLVPIQCARYPIDGAHNRTMGVGFELGEIIVEAKFQVNPMLPIP